MDFKKCSIVDFGCGTGLAGKHLKDLGFENIHGLDLSLYMIDKAECTEAYQTLEHITLGTSDFLD